MSSPKLAYLYLPTIALVMCIVGLTLKINKGEAIPFTIWIFIPVMLVLIAIGVKRKVWKE